MRRAKDFALLSQKGRAVFGPFFTIRLRQSGTKSKIGFVASAKVFKTAVERNRGKRRMREVLAAVKALWPQNMDLLFVLKLNVLTADFKELVSSVTHGFEKIPEALKQPARPHKPKARRPTSVVFSKES